MLLLLEIKLLQLHPVVTRSSGGIFWDRLIGGTRYGISPVDLFDIVIARLRAPR